MTEVVEEQQDTSAQLLERVRELALKYGLASTGKPRLISVLKLLGSEVCERKIEHELKTGIKEEGRRFDSIYRERSSFATSLIIDHIKRRLTEEGFSVAIRTEERSELNIGVFDVTIRVGDPCLICRNGKEKVRLEIKASMGMQLEQIQRYLFDPSPLILVRVIPGHVMLLERRELEGFVDFALKTVLPKADRLKDGRPFVVPGPHCLNCGDASCPFNYGKRTMNDGLITMSDAEFNEDMKLFFTNLPLVAERTAELVIKELVDKQQAGESGKV
jgi:hypothetical protein